MAWQEKLRPASFKKAEFFVSSSEGSFGRKVVLHEFPRKEFPLAEDLGKKAREFSFDAYVLGDDYFDARDEILKVCQEDGAGDLVHPYLGKLYAICTGIKLKESAGSGGIAEFTLSFVEQEKKPVASGLLDFVSGLGLAAEALRDAAAEAFDDAFSIVGQANVVADAAVDAVESVADSLASVERIARGNILKISEFAYKVRKIKGAVRSILGIPGGLSSAYMGAMDTLKNAFDGNETALRVFQKVALPLPTLLFQKTAGGSVNGNAIFRNASALDNFRKQVSASHHAELLTTATFSTLDDAVSARAAVLDVLEEQKEVAGDKVFQAIEALRVALLNAVPSRDESLSRLVTVEVPDTTPSLVLAHDLFDGIEYEADILARNRIVNPGFIPAGSSLKVRANA